MEMWLWVKGGGIDYLFGFVGEMTLYTIWLWGVERGYGLARQVG